MQIYFHKSTIYKGLFSSAYDRTNSTVMKDYNLPSFGSRRQNLKKEKDIVCTLSQIRFFVPNRYNYPNSKSQKYPAPVWQSS